MLLEVSLERKDSLIVVSLVDQIESDLFWELDVCVGVLRVENVLRFDVAVD